MSVTHDPGSFRPLCVGYVPPTDGSGQAIPYQPIGLGIVESINVRKARKKAAKKFGVRTSWADFLKNLRARVGK
jgi:hypothetical protein